VHAEEDGDDEDEDEDGDTGMQRASLVEFCTQRAVRWLQPYFADQYRLYVPDVGTQVCGK
jgi:hypothetical protein